MQINLSEYVTYLRAHKSPSVKTLQRYEDTLKVININQVDSDKLPELYKSLLKILPDKGYSYVNTYLAIMSAWLHKNGLKHYDKEINYYTLQDEIKKLVGSRDSYSDEELNLLFASAHGRGHSELKKLMVLMLYSGLRVGGCYPLKYDDVSKVSNYDLYTYLVFSKGVRYYAIISGNAWRYLLANRKVGQKLIVQHDDSYTTSFDKLYRDELNRCILRNSLHSLRKDKSIFHSIRKSFSQKLLSVKGVDPRSYYYKALMGHVPHDTTATKYYVTPDGKKIPIELIENMADLYSKSVLPNLKLGLEIVKEAD